MLNELKNGKHIGITEFVNVSHFYKNIKLQYIILIS